VLRHYDSKELFFAVVGHVGSGTSEVAKQLEKVLASNEAGFAFDVTVLEWAEPVSLRRLSYVDLEARLEGGAA
jgi:hypothetical protein